MTVSRPRNGIVIISWPRPAHYRTTLPLFTAVSLRVSASRVWLSVKTRDSRGILFIKGDAIQPNPVGISRLSEMASS